MSVMDAANFLGKNLSTLVKYYRASVNINPLADDDFYRYWLHLVNYELVEKILDRECWSYDLLNLEYNQILEKVQESCKSARQSVEYWTPWAEEAIRNIESLKMLKSKV